MNNYKSIKTWSSSRQLSEMCIQLLRYAMASQAPEIVDKVINFKLN